MTEFEKTSLLLESLKSYQTGLLANATWAMGISAIAAGWLITSADARNFLSCYPNICYFFAVLIGFGTLGYALLVNSIKGTAKEILCKLSSIDAAKGLFEHHEISSRFVRAYIAFQVAASAGLITLLLLVAESQ